MSSTPPLASNPSQDRGPAVLGLFIGFTIAAGLFVALRIAIRLQRGLFGGDDAVIAFAMIASVCMTVMVCISVDQGYGKHMGDIPDPAVPLAWFYGAQVCYKCATWPTKLSILLLYRRIFGDTPNIKAYGIRFKALLWTMMFVVVGTFIATSIVGIFSCDPIQYNWVKTIDGTCVQTIPWWFAYAALNISTDIIILALPIPLIKSLMQITRRQKFILMGVFIVGAFVCIVTIVRMTTLKTGAKGRDPTYFGVDTLMWTGVETNVGLMCACLPLLRPILNKLFPWFARRTDMGTPAMSTYHSSGQNRTSPYANAGNSWSNWGKGQNVIMSNVSAERQESRGSSEAGITDGIVVVRQVDIEGGDTSNEDFEDPNRCRQDSQDSQATSSKYVV